MLKEFAESQLYGCVAGEHFHWQCSCRLKNTLQLDFNSVYFSGPSQLLLFSLNLFEMVKYLQ